MPKRLCLQAGCDQASTYRGYCQSHSTEKERGINRAGSSIYKTKRWSLTRRKKLSLSPLCERCGSLADTVHHRVDIAEGGDEWAMSNLESLCASCHSQETRRRQAA